MSVKTAIQPIVVRAQKAGIRLPLSKLRDAIGLALYRKTVSPLVAAESAGQTFASSMDAAAIPAIAAEYRTNAETEAGVVQRDAWSAAETAALDAAFAGWARRPEGATLGMA